MLRMSQEERFWIKVDKSYHPKDCWIFLPVKDRSNKEYGHTRYNNIQISAHRAAWIYTHGLIPIGFEVMHICNNRHCVNPAHLKLGTHAENMAYMKACGRTPKTHPKTTGDRNGARLHPELLARGVDHWTYQFPGVHRGEHNPRARVSERDVVEMRKLWQAGLATKIELATKYGISKHTVSQIVYHQTWKSVV